MDEAPVAGHPNDPAARVAEIERRLAELRRARPVWRDRSVAMEQVEAAQRRVLDAARSWRELVAQTLMARQLLMQAFINAARAHERAAEVNERSARAGIGDVAEYRRRAEFHRAAAEADRQQAEQIQAQDTEPEPPG